MVAAFRVELPWYAGPMDLLLYLIRREELDLSQLSLARVTSQYLDFLEVLQTIQLDSVADFLEPAGWLVELKARHVMPRADEDEPSAEGPTSDEMSEELMEHLIAYQQFREVAWQLDERGRDWQQRYARQARDGGLGKLRRPTDRLASIEVWDLVSAFGRILRQRQAAPRVEVIYDETPIQLYMERVHAKLRTERSVEVQSLFEPTQHKSGLIGIFLASLELIRHHGVVADQPATDGALWLSAGPDFPDVLTLARPGAA